MNIVLTEEQTEALVNADRDGYKYIVLDDGDLFPHCYKLLPVKIKASDAWYDYSDDWLKLDYIEFDFIKWTDDKPYLIEDLLNMNKPEEKEDGMIHALMLLSDEEIKALKEVQDYFSCIAIVRDSSGNLFANPRSSLTKEKQEWFENNASGGWKHIKDKDSDLFKFIQWEDNKPWSIKSLLGSVEVKPEPNTDEKGLEAANIVVAYNDPNDIKWDKPVCPNHGALKGIAELNKSTEPTNTFSPEQVLELVTSIHNAAEDDDFTSFKEDKKTVPHLPSIDNPYNGYDPMGFYK